jgi:phage/plasmid-like protein (TIGR03299 family)
MKKSETVFIAQESMNQGKQIVSLLEKFGLFWNVNKINLIADGEPTQFYGTQREDTKDVFACVKNGYQVLQNWELAEIITEVAGRFDMGVASGGSLNHGAKVYLQVHTGDLKGIGENHDTVKKYITAMNSHDGSASVGFGMTNVTISCSNTFHAAYKGVSKVRHTMSMMQKIEVLTNEFESVKMEEQTLYDTFRKLANAPASEKTLLDVIKMATSVDASMKEKKASSVYSKYQIGKAQQLHARLAEEMAVKGQTLWGLFSGVTKYTNRDLRTPNRDNATQESKLIGGANKLDNKVFNLLESIIA